MSGKEHSVFGALKELFVQHPEGGYPFDQEIFEEILNASTDLNEERPI